MASTVKGTSQGTFYFHDFASLSEVRQLLCCTARLKRTNEWLIWETMR